MKVLQAVRFVFIETFKSTGTLLTIYIFLSFLLSLSVLFQFFLFKEIIDTVNGGTNIFHTTVTGLMEFFFAYKIATHILSQYADHLEGLIDIRQTIANTDRFVGKLATLDLANFEDPKMYDTIWRAFNRIPWQLRFYLDTAIKFLRSCTELLFSIVLFISASPLAGGIIVVSNALNILVKTKFGELSFNIYKENSELKRRFEYSASLVTNRDVLAEIKQFQGFPFIKKKLMSIYHAFAKKQLPLMKKAWMAQTVVGLLPVIAMFVFLFSILSKLEMRTLSTGSFVFLFSNIFVFNSALNGLGMYLTTLISDSHFIHDAIDFYAIKRNIAFVTVSESKLHELTQKLSRPTITIDNVSFRYPNGVRNALSQISLTIPFGQNIAIVGENGAGKTTLVKLLLRVYEPTEGRILLNGIELKDIPERLLFHTYATLFQSFGKFYLTIRENMQLAAHEKQEENFIHALKKSNAWNFVQEFPKRLDQQLGPNYSDGVDLSGGQWQQLAIGRALVRHSPILILDEPTSAVDARSEMEIFDRLHRETRDTTVIFISHRFSTIKDAERIVVIDKGRITEDGTHETLMRKKGGYSVLYQLQAERYARE